MCGRFTLRTPAEAIVEHFGLPEFSQTRLRFNIAPTQIVAALRAGDPKTPADRPQLAWLKWGLVPHWAKDPSIGSRMINARAETAAQKPAFRDALRSRRCLILADGFYEWRKAGAKKIPYYFTMADDRPFAFAGLWERYRGPDQTPLETCTILTTDANALVRPIHDRMPVILPHQDYAAWLDRENRNGASLSTLLGPYDAGLMRHWPVSKAVGSPRHDTANCIAPVEADL